MRFKVFASLSLVALFAVASFSFAQQVALLDQVKALQASTDALNARLDASDKRQDATDTKIDALAAKVDACTCNCQAVAKADPFAPTQAKWVCGPNGCSMVPVTSSGAVYADPGSCGSASSGGCGAGRGGFFRRLLGR